MHVRSMRGDQNNHSSGEFALVFNVNAKAAILNKYRLCNHSTLSFVNLIFVTQTLIYEV